MRTVVSAEPSFVVRGCLRGPCGPTFVLVLCPWELSPHFTGEATTAHGRPRSLSDRARTVKPATGTERAEESCTGDRGAAAGDVTALTGDWSGGGCYSQSAASHGRGSSNSFSFAAAAPGAGRGELLAAATRLPGVFPPRGCTPRRTLLRRWRAQIKQLQLLEGQSLGGASQRAFRQPAPRVLGQVAASRGRCPSTAEERPGTWYGFGFCGFGQALGSGRGLQVHSPEPMWTPVAGVDICRVSASWSYTACLTRGGRLELSGSASGAVGGCRDAWASEALLVVLRCRQGPGEELQGWAPGSALRGEPLWSQTVESEAARKHGSGGEAGARALPLLPSASAYVSPRPPFYLPLAPELRARRLELGAEHVLLLDAAGQVFSWGGGRHGQLGHGTLEAELEPRLLEAVQGLPMAEVAAGGWHSVCVSGRVMVMSWEPLVVPQLQSLDWNEEFHFGCVEFAALAANPETGDLYVWGWNESGQLALPTRGLAEDGKPVAGEATGLPEEGSEVRAAGGEDGAPSPFIAVQPFPALLDLPQGSEAAHASCGSRHTAVVTRTGELYTWGWGKYGQLGHKDTTSLDHPCRVEFFRDKQLPVEAVTCGPWNTYVYTVERRNC